MIVEQNDISVFPGTLLITVITSAVFEISIRRCIVTEI